MVFRYAGFISLLAKQELQIMVFLHIKEPILFSLNKRTRYSQAEIIRNITVAILLWLKAI